jgi:hypothetical protein
MNTDKLVHRHAFRTYRRARYGLRDGDQLLVRAVKSGQPG